MTDEINQKPLDSFPPFSNIQYQPPAKQSPRQGQIKKYQSKPYIERSDFLDALAPNLIPQDTSLDDLDILETPFPKENREIPRRFRSRRASDSLILVSDFQNAFNKTANDTRRRRRESTDLFKDDESSIRNSFGMTFPNPQKPKFTIFNSSSLDKGSDSPKSAQAARRKQKPRVIYVDEFDDAPKVLSPLASDDSDQGKDSIREWESTPRKTDIHRQSRRPADIDIE